MFKHAYVSLQYWLTYREIRTAKDHTFTTFHDCKTDGRLEILAR
jgi:hypothetical protein